MMGVQQLRSWHAYLWEHTKYRGCNQRQAIAIAEREPELFAVFVAIHRIKR